MAAIKHTADDQARLVIDPMENVLIGSNIIMQYLKIHSFATMYQWIELYGLPCIKRPDGTWMTTISSIDEWIFMAAELDNENRPQSRGYSQRLDIAAARLQSRIEQKELQGGHLKRGPAPYTEANERFAELTEDMPKRQHKPKPNAS